MDLRRAKSNDLNMLISLERLVFDQHAYNHQQLRYLLTKAKATTYVTKNEDGIVGWAIMLWKKSVRVGRLYSIGVRPDHRRKGIANQLLAQLEDDAIQRDCNRTTLETTESNIGGQAFYRARGYVVTEKMPGYFHDGSNAIRMVKRL